MPVFLPPRQGISQSNALAEARAFATKGEPILITLEIQHPTFRDDNNNPTSIFIVNDFTSLMATLEADAPIKPGEVVEFLPLQFKFTRPEESSSAAPPDITIEVQNATREIMRHVEHARESDAPVKIMVRTYLPSDTSAPHESPVPVFVVKSVTATMQTITIKAGFGNLINERFPKCDYTRDSNPGLTQG